MYHIISDNKELADLCERWGKLSYLCIDTEFVRTRTFYPRAGLIQVAADTACYLIDPLSITDFAPLKSLFRNSSVTKVLHS